MKKVAIFGNAGAGKSTLAKDLSQITDLPLIILDKITYLPGGDKIPLKSPRAIKEFLTKIRLDQNRTKQSTCQA